jgi:hypothetical protein
VHVRLTALPELAKLPTCQVVTIRQVAKYLCCKLVALGCILGQEHSSIQSFNLLQGCHAKGGGREGIEPVGKPCFELAIKRWTRHHVHNTQVFCTCTHIMSPQLKKKAPPAHYKEHTSRSILDVRGLASQRNQGAQPMDIIDRRVGQLGKP